MRVGVVQQNIKFSIRRKDAAVCAGIAGAITYMGERDHKIIHTSIVGNNEFQTRHARKIYDQTVWQSVQGGRKTGRPGPRGEVALSVRRKDWKVLSWSTMLTGKRTHFIPGATRYSLVAHLESVKHPGKEVVVMVGHSLAHIEVRGHPGMTNNNHDRINHSNFKFAIDAYIAWCDDFFATAQSLHEEYECPVILCFDGNVDYQADAKVQYEHFPYEQMRQHGIQSIYAALPHMIRSGRQRDIDQIAVTYGEGHFLQAVRKFHPPLDHPILGALLNV